MSERDIVEQGSDAAAAEGPTVVADDDRRTPEDARVASLLAVTIDVPVLAEAVGAQEAADAADVLEDLAGEEAAEVVLAMDGQSAAEALAQMQVPLAAGVLEDLVDEGRTDVAARLIRMMASDDAADLLQALPVGERESILAGLSLEESAALRKLVGYRDDSAAGLMTTDFLLLAESMSVQQATEAIRAAAINEELTHLPVGDPEGRLIGLVGLRDLLLARGGASIETLIDRQVRAIGIDLDQESVARTFDRYDVSMMPVVDPEGRVVGVVTVDDVIDIIREEQTEDVQRSVGAGAEEAVYSSIAEKFRGRFRWLIVSFFLMLPSALIVLRFEGLIEEIAVLAIFMPIVAALAGNAGHQALAVTLRGIVLDEVRTDRVAGLLRREALVGLLVGAGLGVLICLVVAAAATVVPSVSWRLGAIVAISMTLSMGAGTIAGSAIPLAMRRFGFDPAQSSAIFLIMITDAVAFATYLGFASVLHAWLVA